MADTLNSLKSKTTWNPLTIVLLLSAAFFMVFLIVSGALFMYRAPGGGSSAKASLFSDGGAVGVVEISGVIMDSRKTLARLE
ncbi:hypothetical protein WDW86_19160, partial [Bdellovibrionota bacterium FG-2]